MTTIKTRRSDLMIAPANEKSTGDTVNKDILLRLLSRELTYFLRRMRSAQYTKWSQYQWNFTSCRTMAHQLLQVFPIFPAQAAIRLPDPVPTWCMFSPSGEKYDSIICFHCKSKKTIRSLCYS